MTIDQSSEKSFAGKTNKLHLYVLSNQPGDWSENHHGGRLLICSAMRSLACKQIYEEMDAHAAAAALGKWLHSWLMDIVCAVLK